MGKHKGIFGGPYIDVTDLLVKGRNEVVVEVLSANFRNAALGGMGMSSDIVKGWFLTGGVGMEPFFNLGMWRGARLEVVSHYHIERPFLYTKSLDDKKATIGFSLEIFSGKHSLDYQLHSWKRGQVVSSSYFPKEGKENLVVPDDLIVSVNFLDDGKVAYSGFPYVTCLGECID